jgi:hypothetical protein
VRIVSAQRDPVVTLTEPRHGDWLRPMDRLAGLGALSQGAET